MGDADGAARRPALGVCLAVRVLLMGLGSVLSLVVGGRVLGVRLVVRVGLVGWGLVLVLPLVADRAELLTATALAVGDDWAVRVTRTALGEDEFVAILPVLQSAGISPELRSAVHQEKLSLKDLRQAAADAAGVDLPAMAQLHRVSLGELLVTSVSVLAVSFVISALADIGLDTIIDVLADASWAFVWRFG